MLKFACDGCGTDLDQNGEFAAVVAIVSKGKRRSRREAELCISCYDGTDWRELPMRGREPGIKNKPKSLAAA